MSAPAVLGPPQMLSLVEMRDDAHPKLVLINIPPPPVTHGLSIVLSACVFRASEHGLSK